MDHLHFSAPSRALINPADEALRRSRAADHLIQQRRPVESADRLTAVYATYRPRIQAFITAQLRHRDSHLAEDLTQEVFVRVLRDLGAARADDNRLFSWLATIARRVVADHYRLCRSTREVPADTSGTDWADTQLAPTESGAYAVIRNGVRAKAEVNR